MASRSASWLMGCAIVWAAALICPAADRAAAAPPDRAALRETCKELWDSLETLEFHEETYQCDDKLQPDRAKGYGAYEYAFGSGGRRACLTKAIYPEKGSEKIIADLRRDGKQRHSVTYFDDGTVDAISSGSDYETHDDSPTALALAMSFVSPFGKPLHAYLDDAGTSVEEGRSDEGDRIIVLSATARGRPVRMEIDPARDWLIRRFKMGDDHERRVLRFERENGRWFPTEGLIVNVRKDGEERAKFVVSKLRINRPIPASRFQPPAPARGVLVGDDTTGRARISGGVSARKRLLEVHKPASTSATRGGGDALRASAAPDRSRWPMYLGLPSVALIVLAFYLYRR